MFNVKVSNLSSDLVPLQRFLAHVQAHEVAKQPVAAPTCNQTISLLVANSTFKQNINSVEINVLPSNHNFTKISFKKEFCLHKTVILMRSVDFTEFLKKASIFTVIPAISPWV